MDFKDAIISVVSLVVGVAIISVLVSTKSNTAGVLGAAGSSFANVLSAATAPVTGNAATPNVGSGSNPFGGLGTSALSTPVYG